MTKRIALAPIKEKEYMGQIIEVARLFRWSHIYHPWLSVKSEPGWPDLALVRNNVLAFLEVKTDRGLLTRAQREWIDVLSQVEIVQAHVVRPSDWNFVRELLQ
jgi:hypothetical protein